MDYPNQQVPLQTRCFSNRKQRWRHTANGQREIIRQVGDFFYNSESSGSSSASQPPSPTGGTFSRPVSPYPQRRELPPSSIQVLTWNIDFMAPNSGARMQTALDHIQCKVFDCPDGDQPDPCVILFQEVNEESMSAISEHTWIRTHFSVVPLGVKHWPSSQYGNVTLVARTIITTSAQSLVFGNSCMGRHALLVDLCLTTSSSSSLLSSDDSETDTSDGPTAPQLVTLRVANVHLESLPQGTAARPGQLTDTANMLREGDIYAGLVCGDMNAIRPSDESIHEEAGLLDAWRGSSGSKKGFTWGYQPRCQYSPGRLDKILYTSDERCIVGEPKRVGVGLKTKSGRWVSDHYGLLTTVRMTK